MKIGKTAFESSSTEKRMGRVLQLRKDQNLSLWSDEPPEIRAACDTKRF